MKKLSLILISILLITTMVGCSSSYDSYNNQTTESYTADDTTEQSEVNEETSITVEDSLDSSINIEGGIAYFDMTLDQFVDAYNSTLAGANSVNYLTDPQYVQSGTGVQGTTIYQYNVSNGLGSIYNFVHTDQDDNVLEVVISAKKVLGQVTVNTADILYNDLGEMAMVLTNLSQEEWDILADGLSDKILKKEQSLIYYYNGVSVDTWSDANGVYFRISCMTEEKYEELI